MSEFRLPHDTNVEVRGPQSQSVLVEHSKVMSWYEYRPALREHAVSLLDLKCRASLLTMRQPTRTLEEAWGPRYQRSYLLVVPS